jgi:hypothetical protein
MHVGMRIGFVGGGMRKKDRQNTRHRLKLASLKQRSTIVDM